MGDGGEGRELRLDGLKGRMNEKVETKQGRKT